MARLSLPDDERLLLNSLRFDLPLLRARTQSLRAAGWTLTSIGQSFSPPVGRSTVHSWAAPLNPLGPADLPRLLALPPVPEPPLRTTPSLPPSPSLPVRALSPDVPADDAARIAHLAPQARRVRHTTPLTSPLRAASAELDTLLLRYRDLGVPVARLASLAGVTYRALALRLARAEHPSATATATATAPSAPTPPKATP